MALGQSTALQEIEGGNFNVKFTELTTSNLLLDTYINFENGKNYSVFLCNKKSAVEALTIYNTFTLADTNNTAFRFINLIPNASVDVYLDGVKSGNSLAFKGSSSFIEATPTVTKIELKVAGNTSAILTIPKFTGAKKKIYNIYFYGVAGGSPAPTFNLIAVN